MLITTVLLLLCLSCNYSSAVSVKDFYPFGELVGDTALERGISVFSPEVNLKSAISVGGSQFSSYWVGTDGVITFLQPGRRTGSMCIDWIGFSWVGPFYVPADTSSYGNVFYRETTDPTVLTRALGEIQNGTGILNMSPISALVVTWTDITFANYTGKTQPPPRNSFQAVLLAMVGQSTTASFAIFNYADIQWTSSDFSAACGGASSVTGLGGHCQAAIGFNNYPNYTPGPGSYYTSKYELDGGCSSSTISMSERSNVPQSVPGLWVLRIDGSGAAFLNDSEVVPNIEDMMGHNSVHLTLPDRFNTSTKISCLFHDSQVSTPTVTEGQFILDSAQHGYFAASSSHVRCDLPFSFSYGTNSLSIEIGYYPDIPISSFTYANHIFVLPPEPMVILDVVNASVVQYEITLNITWDPEELLQLLNKESLNKIESSGSITTPRPIPIPSSSIADTDTPKPIPTPRSTLPSPAPKTKIQPTLKPTLRPTSTMKPTHVPTLNPTSRPTAKPTNVYIYVTVFDERNRIWHDPQLLVGPVPNTGQFQITVREPLAGVILTRHFVGSVTVMTPDSQVSQFSSMFIFDDLYGKSAKENRLSKYRNSISTRNVRAIRDEPLATFNMMGHQTIVVPHSMYPNASNAACSFSTFADNPPNPTPFIQPGIISLDKSSITCYAPFYYSYGLKTLTVFSAESIDGETSVGIDVIPSYPQVLVTQATAKIVRGNGVAPLEIGLASAGRIWKAMTDPFNRNGLKLVITLRFTWDGTVVRAQSLPSLQAWLYPFDEVNNVWESPCLVSTQSFSANTSSVDLELSKEAITYFFDKKLVFAIGHKDGTVDWGIFSKMWHPQ